MIWTFDIFAKKCDFRIIGIKEKVFKFEALNLKIVS